MELINEIKKVLENATPAPWEWSVKNRLINGQGGFDLGELSHWKSEEVPRNGTIILEVILNKYGQYVISAGNKNDINLISNAPTWLNTLIELVDKLQTENAEERAAHNSHVTELIAKDAFIKSLKEQMNNHIRGDQEVKRLQLLDAVDKRKEIESQKAEINDLRAACTAILSAHNERGAALTGACGDNDAVIKARLGLSQIRKGTLNEK